jgi:hypothetical protein
VEGAADVVVVTTSRALRQVGAWLSEVDWVRAADAALARGGTRNAAESLAQRRAEILDNLRTLRDLREVEIGLDIDLAGLELRAEAVGEQRTV